MFELLRWWRSDPNLYIDPRRINAEVQAERRAEADTADMAYRSRIKRRMLQGLTSEQMPPLYRREAKPKPCVVTPFMARR